MWKDYHNWVNQHIYHLLYLFIIFWGVKTLKFFFSKFRLYNIVLSTVVSMLCIRSSELFIL